MFRPEVVIAGRDTKILIDQVRTIDASYIAGDLVDYLSRDDMGQVEHSLSVSRHFQDLVVPGLLQTADYMRASTRQLTPDVSDSGVDRVVNVRRRRQELLDRADAPEMFFVLDESVIRRVVGSKGLMRDQLQRMIEATEKPNITIEVVPFTAGLVPGLQAPFVIQEFSDASDDELLYLESPRGDALIRDDREEVLAYREYFEQLRRASLGPEGTIKFLNEVTTELS